MHQAACSSMPIKTHRVQHTPAEILSSALHKWGQLPQLLRDVLSRLGPGALSATFAVTIVAHAQVLPPGADGAVRYQALGVENSATVASPTKPSLGINMSEAEYSWGSFPSNSDLLYFASNGLKIVRLPIAWERAQPALGGALDAAYLSALTQCIRAAGANGMQVIVDVHNYGRYNSHWAQDAANNYGYAATGNGDVIGSAALPIPMFAEFWTKLAKALRGTPGLSYYDLMNEPHDMGGAGIWPTAAQAAVNAIRSIDTATSILVEGDQWASAQYWPWDNGSLHLTDPSNRLFYEAHQYFDGNGSGNYAQTYDASGAYPNIGVDRLQPFVGWLSKNHAKGFLGEFGVPNNDPRWLTVLDNFLTSLAAAGLSGTYWNYTFHSATDPAWWPVADPVSIRLGNGQSNPQMNVLVRHNGLP